MKRGLSAEQSEWLTYHVIKALLEDPAVAAKLIVQIPAE